MLKSGHAERCGHFPRSVTANVLRRSKRSLKVAKSFLYSCLVASSSLSLSICLSLSVSLYLSLSICLYLFGCYQIEASQVVFTFLIHFYSHFSNYKTDDSLSFYFCNSIYIFVCFEHLACLVFHLFALQPALYSHKS